MFRLQLPRVGALRALTVGHSASGAAPKWHLEQVEVVDEQTGGVGGLGGWRAQRFGGWCGW